MTNEQLKKQRDDLLAALKQLVSHLEADPSLYDGDDNGERGRVMQQAHEAAIWSIVFPLNPEGGAK